MQSSYNSNREYARTADIFKPVGVYYDELSNFQYSPLVMNWLLGMFDEDKGFKIDEKTDTIKYVKDIIDTYNKIQDAHVKLFEHTRRLMNIQSNNNDIPATFIEISQVPLNSRDEFFKFMQSIKNMIKRMSKQASGLATLVFDHMPSSRQYALKKYYEDIMYGRIPLVPLGSYSKTPINLELDKIFSMYGGVDIKTLTDVQEVLGDATGIIKNLQDWNPHLINIFIPNDATALLTEEEKKIRGEKNGTEKELKIEKFSGYDINKIEINSPIKYELFEPEIDEYNMDRLINNVIKMYPEFDKQEGIVRGNTQLLKDFVKYNFDDIGINDFINPGTSILLILKEELKKIDDYDNNNKMITEELEKIKAKTTKINGYNKEMATVYQFIKFSYDAISKYNRMVKDVLGVYYDKVPDINIFTEYINNELTPKTALALIEFIEKYTNIDKLKTSYNVVYTELESMIKTIWISNSGNSRINITDRLDTEKMNKEMKKWSSPNNLMDAIVNLLYTMQTYKDNVSTLKKLYQLCFDNVMKNIIDTNINITTESKNFLILNMINFWHDMNNIINYRRPPSNYSILYETVKTLDDVDFSTFSGINMYNIAVKKYNLDKNQMDARISDAEKIEVNRIHEEWIQKKDNEKMANVNTLYENRKGKTDTPWISLSQEQKLYYANIYHKEDTKNDISTAKTKAKNDFINENRKNYIDTMSIIIKAEVSALTLQYEDTEKKKTQKNTAGNYVGTDTVNEVVVTSEYTQSLNNIFNSNNSDSNNSDPFNMNVDTSISANVLDTFSSDPFAIGNVDNHSDAGFDDFVVPVGYDTDFFNNFHDDGSYLPDSDGADLSIDDPFLEGGGARFEEVKTTVEGYKSKFKALLKILYDKLSMIDRNKKDIQQASNTLYDYKKMADSIIKISSDVLNGIEKKEVKKYIPCKKLFEFKKNITDIESMPADKKGAIDRAMLFITRIEKLYLKSGINIDELWFIADPAKKKTFLPLIMTTYLIDDLKLNNK